MLGEIFELKHDTKKIENVEGKVRVMGYTK